MVDFRLSGAPSVRRGAGKKGRKALEFRARRSFATRKPTDIRPFSNELDRVFRFSTVFSTVVENLGEKPKPPKASVFP